MKKILISLGLLTLLCGCQTKEKVVDHYITQKPETVYVEVPVEVEKPIYVEKEVEVEKIIEKPVDVEKIVEVEKVVEVEKEVIKEVEVEVEKPIYIETTKEVEKIVEVPVEVEKIVEVEKPVYIEKEVIKEVEVVKYIDAPENITYTESKGYFQNITTEGYHFDYLAVTFVGGYNNTVKCSPASIYPGGMGNHIDELYQVLSFEVEQNIKVNLGLGILKNVTVTNVYDTGNQVYHVADGHVRVVTLDIEKVIQVDTDFLTNGYTKIEASNIHSWDDISPLLKTATLIESKDNGYAHSITNTYQINDNRTFYFMDYDNSYNGGFQLHGQYYKLDNTFSKENQKVLLKATNAGAVSIGGERYKKYTFQITKIVQTIETQGQYSGRTSEVCYVKLVEVVGVCQITDDLWIEMR